MKPLDDGTVRLRALEPTDLDCLYRWENDTALWCVGSTITPFSRKQLWDYIESYDGDIYAARQLRLMIEVAGIEEPVGTIDMFEFDAVNRRVAVGVLIDRAYMRRGFGRRSVELVCDYCFTTLNLHQVYVDVPQSNAASMALFRSCGFTTSGRLRSWLCRGGVYEDVIVMQRLKS